MPGVAFNLAPSFGFVSVGFLTNSSMIFNPFFFIFGLPCASFSVSNLCLRVSPLVSNLSGAGAGLVIDFFLGWASIVFISFTSDTICLCSAAVTF